jgi:hypothetical protein
MILTNGIIKTGRVTEILSAAHRIIGEFDSGQWETETTLTAIFDAFKTAYNKLDFAIQREKAISTLEAKDEIRDDAIRSLYTIFNGYLVYPVASVKEAAKTLKPVMDRYGLKILKYSYANESGFVFSMLTDLEAADIQPVIAAMPSFSDLIATLKTAQNDFENTRLEYEREIAQYNSEDSASVLKLNVGTILNEKILPYLMVMSGMDSTKYLATYETISKIVEDTNEEIRRRRDSDDSKDDEKENE